jgi:hypothetical protein
MGVETYGEQRTILAKIYFSNFCYVAWENKKGKLLREPIPEVFTIPHGL